MKTVFFFLITLSSLFCFARGNSPSEKVLDAFKRTFKDVHEVAWSDDGEHYSVKFKQNAILTRIIYDKEGNIVKALRYYFEENLPVLVLAKVKASYKNQTIFGVTEECNADRTIYHIVLEDGKHWYHITADTEGDSHLDQKLNKA